MSSQVGLLFCALWGGGSGFTKKCLGHSVEHGGLGIPGPKNLAAQKHIMLVDNCGHLIAYLLEEMNLYYVGHKA